MSKELFLRAQVLVSEWEGKENQNVPAHIITEIFNVHNEALPHAREYSKGCGGCRQRVWNAVKEWYHTNKHLYSDET